jgi:hypothetical protein
MCHHRRALYYGLLSLSTEAVNIFADMADIVVVSAQNIVVNAMYMIGYKRFLSEILFL